MQMRKKMTDMTTPFELSQEYGYDLNPGEVRYLNELVVSNLTKDEGLAQFFCRGYIVNSQLYPHTLKLRKIVKSALATIANVN
jgi:hypothetical protein